MTAVGGGESLPGPQLRAGRQQTACLHGND